MFFNGYLLARLFVIFLGQLAAGEVIRKFYAYKSR